MSAFPGVVVLWSGNVPRHDVRRIPASGLTLGRDDVDPSDHRISRRHVTIWVRDERLLCRDDNSRNGTFVAGERIRSDHTPVLPAVIRIGRTVAVAVSDLRPYEAQAALDEDADGPVLAWARRELDEAARAEDNVTIEGPAELAMPLAHRYAGTIGGRSLVFDPAVQTLEGALAGTSPRGVILALADRALSLADMPAIRTWLETDVRFVTVMTPGTHPLSMLEPGAIARLRRRVIRVWRRFERVPARVVEVVRAPEATIHATVIEALALELCRVDEATALARFRAAVERWRATGQATLRAEDLRRDERAQIEAAVCMAMPRPDGG